MSYSHGVVLYFFWGGNGKKYDDSYILSGNLT